MVVIFRRITDIGCGQLLPGILDGFRHVADAHQAVWSRFTVPGRHRIRLLRNRSMESRYVARWGKCAEVGNRATRVYETWSRTGSTRCSGLPGRRDPLWLKLQEHCGGQNLGPKQNPRPGTTVRVESGNSIGLRRQKPGVKYWRGPGRVRSCSNLTSKTRLRSYVINHSLPLEVFVTHSERSPRSGAGRRHARPGLSGVAREGRLAQDARDNRGRRARLDTSQSEPDYARGV